MNLEIISPEKTVYSGVSESVMLPGINGLFTILDRHAPIISVLTKGVVTYSVNGEKAEVMISGGFVEAIQNNVSVCIE
ncbi:MAG: F0F1 ATP synthase subunit epsilon [Tannerella sp.]|jgi:F-type H+-transporting ATPase subunit epsilon|nr:F0F1 ATP synthase subunit epsilon [Tannerella sp.]